MDYKKAGVDIEAGYKSVELMKEHVKGTMRPEVLEANGDSYSGYERVSAMTGLPKRYLQYESLAATMGNFNSPALSRPWRRLTPVVVSSVPPRRFSMASARVVCRRWTWSPPSSMMMLGPILITSEICL